VEEDSENVVIPNWIDDLLDESLPQPAFKARSREAVAVGLAIGRMRIEREQVGFVPIGFGAYLKGLARVANVNWNRLCAWIGVDPETVTEDSAGRLARVAADLGFDLRSLLLHLRIAVAESIEKAPIPVIVAYRRNAGQSGIDDCEGTLRDMELDWEPGERDQLRRIEAAACDGFADAEG